MSSAVVGEVRIVQSHVLKSQITADSVTYEQWTQVVLQQGLCLTFSLLPEPEMQLFLSSDVWRVYTEIIWL